MRGLLFKINAGGLGGKSATCRIPVFAVNERLYFAVGQGAIIVLN